MKVITKGGLLTLIFCCFLLDGSARSDSHIDNVTLAIGAETKLTNGSAEWMDGERNESNQINKGNNITDVHGKDSTTSYTTTTISSKGVTTRRRYVTTSNEMTTKSYINTHATEVDKKRETSTARDIDNKHVVGIGHGHANDIAHGDRTTKAHVNESGHVGHGGNDGGHSNHGEEHKGEGHHEPGGEHEGEHGGELGGEHGGDGHHGNGSHHGEHRFQVAKFAFDYVKTPFIVGVWILYAICAKLFFHWEKHISKIFPESCILITIGVIFGVILYVVGEKMYEVNTTIFFLVLLPPIILDAGYYMPARAFFDQLGTILLYAILGTLLNNLLIGFSLWGVYQGGGFENLTSPLLLLHSLVLGSLLAAVDPVAVLAVFESVQVNEMLYIIVFGESLLNDGISVVLYHLFEGFSEIGIENIQGIDILAGIASFFVIVFGATGIGILMGLLAGFISRFTKYVRKMEPLLVLVIGYLSFIIAEMFHLSGIISCTFCGITMRKYVEANFTEKSNKAIHIVLKMFAQASETIVFMYIGMSAVSDIHQWDSAFCILALVFCLIFRTACCVFQTYFANLIRVVKLTKIDMFVMSYGGLRGAIAFALVLLLNSEEFPLRKLFITSTVLVIYFTNLVMGSTIEPLVKLLKVKRQQHRKTTMSEKIVTRFIDHAMSGLEDIAGQSGHHQLRERFSTWNNNFLKPLIVGKANPQRQGWQILSTYNKINQKAAKHHLRRNETGNSILFRDMSCLDLNRAQSSFNLNGSAFPIGSHGPARRGDWWESTVSISRTLQQDMMDSEKDGNPIHHISEDIAGPILKVKQIESDDKHGSFINDDYSPSYQEPIMFGKLQEKSDDIKNRGSGPDRCVKSVSFLDLGAIPVSVISDGNTSNKEDPTQSGDFSTSWISREGGNMDPLRSPSASMVPPNFRASFDPPPAYGLNGYKNYSYQPDLADDERPNINNSNNRFVDDAWYLDDAGDNGRQIRFTRAPRNRLDQISRIDPLETVVIPEESEMKESGTVISPSSMSMKYTKY